MKFRLHFLSLLIFLGILIIEILIAVYIKGGFIRTFVGDVLVVALVYFFVRSFIKSTPWKVVLGVFIFACLVEFAQYFNVVEILGLENNALARTIIGTTFDWGDIGAYAVGCVFLLGIRK